MGSALTWKLAALLTLQFLTSTKNIVHITNYFIGIKTVDYCELTDDFWELYLSNEK